LELLEAERSVDEEIVCVAEGDACGVDAIQVLLGCTVGKGNLIFDMQGKNAFSFYSRKNGKSVRLVLRRTPDKDRDQRLEWLMNGDYHEMFDVKPAPESVPETSRIFKTYLCEACQEGVSENYVRVKDGKMVCSRCAHSYTRGL
jgi:formylmethanofuran dehydrogenase subunit E